MRPAELLTRWVKSAYEGRLIKRSGEPYFNHLVAVADMAQCATRFGYEIGICHDLLEDTSTTQNELLESLKTFGYSGSESGYIARCVVELTDVFTSHAYPKLSKKARKEKEAARLIGISPGAQTVKYCDLIDNIKWVLKYDEKHALKYLLKKQLALSCLTRGDKETYHNVLTNVQKALDVLTDQSP